MKHTFAVSTEVYSNKDITQMSLANQLLMLLPLQPLSHVL